MTKEQEEWRDIVGYEGYFQVSNYGRVRSVDRLIDGRNGVVKGNIKKQTINNRGRLNVTLYKEGRIKVEKVHRLVAKAFIPNPNNFPEINHKDEDPTNNFVGNLEWCDNSYNASYGTRNERMLETRKNEKCCNAEKEVIKYTLDMVFIEEYRSISEAARKNKLNIASISACCNGKRKKPYGGYIWKFKQQ